MPAWAGSCASPCPTTASWRPKGFRSIAESERAGADLPMQPWKRSAGADHTSSSTAPKGSGACTWSRCPAPARSMSSAISTEDRSCGGGPRIDRVWQEGAGKRHTFEWQRGSLFTIPLNAFHRIVNAASSHHAAVRDLGAERDETSSIIRASSSTAARVHGAVLRRRRFLQAARGCRARSGAGLGDAADQSHPGRHQLRPAAR